MKQHLEKTMLFLGAGVTSIVVGVPMTVLAVYAWFFPALHLKNPYGVAIGVLVAALLGFYYIRKVKSLTIAIVGSSVIAAVVLFLCLFLIVNILGE